jgi:hypothetical protein
MSAGTSIPDGLAAIHTPLGFEPAVLRDRAPTLRPPADRSDPSGRLLPALLGMLAAALVVTGGLRAGQSRPGMARARSLARPTRLKPRAPPSLQPA